MCLDFTQEQWDDQQEQRQRQEPPRPQIHQVPAANPRPIAIGDPVCIIINHGIVNGTVIALTAHRVRIQPNRYEGTVLRSPRNVEPASMWGQPVPFANRFPPARMWGRVGR